ncbi:MAG: flavin-containing monooxygenase [Acidobacteriota bacterium]
MGCGSCPPFEGVPVSVHSIAAVEHVDVLIVGAGLSGIGAAYYLQKEQPSKTYVILESREATGGTWDLFRYPGIRSDSDLHTFGYEFKPWVDKKAIADGGAILNYLRETATENGIDRHIRFHHKVCGASWSSEEARWTVDVEVLGTGLRKTMTCKWLFSAAGYYRYDEGFTPQFEGVERFKGQVIHPQHWPKDLDYRGKRVLIIGSGATAVTLVPAMTDQAAHVTMLQRTPTYVVSLPSADPIANGLRRILPDTWAYAITRRKNIMLSRAIWRLCQKHPRFARRLIRLANKSQLPKGYPVDEHFNPPYNPWDQRLCAVPDGDLFKAISAGRASVVTDHIQTFTEHGVRLKSGRELEADIIITATGLNLQLFGGMHLSVDGESVDLSRKVAYKGMMLDGIPNFGFIVGYTNSSWTLKVGLLSEHFCRLLAYMDRQGYAICRPELPSPDMPTRPLLDFGAGYVQRALPQLPRQGAGAPWLMSMDYLHDAQVLRQGPVEDPCLHFAVAGRASNKPVTQARRA